MTSQVMDSEHHTTDDGVMTETTATPTTRTELLPDPSVHPDHAVRSPHPDCEQRLRVVLRVNALNSIVFGTLLATIPTWIDDVLGTGHPGWIRVVGLGLLPFGTLCAWLSTASPAALRRVTPEIVAGDVAWVVASIATVLLGWYSGRGIVAVLAMAAIVDVLALLQWSAWRRLRVTH